MISTGRPGYLKMAIPRSGGCTDIERMTRAQKTAGLAVAALIVSALAVHYGHAPFGWFEGGQYDLIDTWLMDGALMAAAAIALLGAWRSRHERARRLVLAAGIASFGLAYVVYHLFLTTSELTWPTVSDYMWIAFYLAAAAKPCAHLTALVAAGSAG